ncbi:MAG TPA: DUF6249 domain-containing protein [Bacteroidales bacterium]|nr:DUF6249 domain-containing protein [Bacteroidales bacterium]
MNDVLATAVVFFAIYHIIKAFTDFLLRRKIIKMGHIEKAEILVQQAENKEENRYPTLKWGLVSFLAGLGLILITVLAKTTMPWILNNEGSVLAFGIELVFISLGFLIYFFIMNTRKRE